jgi:hypothetical protein
MGMHGDGPQPREPMSMARFIASLVFVILVIAIICGTIIQLSK